MLCIFDADVIFRGIGGVDGRDGVVFDVHIHREDGAVFGCDFIVVFLVAGVKFHIIMQSAVIIFLVHLNKYSLRSRDARMV